MSDKEHLLKQGQTASRIVVRKQQKQGKAKIKAKGNKNRVKTQNKHTRNKCFGKQQAKYIEHNASHSLCE